MLKKNCVYKHTHTHATHRHRHKHRQRQRHRHRRRKKQRQRQRHRRQRHRRRHKHRHRQTQTRTQTHTHTHTHKRTRTHTETTQIGFTSKTRGIATMKLNWQQRKKYMTTKAQLSTRRVTLATRSMATSLLFLSVAVSATVPTLSLSTTNRFRVSIPPDTLYIVVFVSMISMHQIIDHRISSRYHQTQFRTCHIGAQCRGFYDSCESESCC